MLTYLKLNPIITWLTHLLNSFLASGEIYLPSADKFCKLFGPRSLIWIQTDTLMVFMKEYFEKSADDKNLKNYPACTAVKNFTINWAKI